MTIQFTGTIVSTGRASTVDSLMMVNSVPGVAVKIQLDSDPNTFFTVQVPDDEAPSWVVGYQATFAAEAYDAKVGPSGAIAVRSAGASLAP